MFELTSRQPLRLAIERAVVPIAAILSLTIAILGIW